MLRVAQKAQRAKKISYALHFFAQRVALFAQRVAIICYALYKKMQRVANFFSALHFSCNAFLCSTQYFWATRSNLFTTRCYKLLRVVDINQLECGPMPNLMVALPNTGGALYSTPQSLADAHY